MEIMEKLCNGAECNLENVYGRRESQVDDPCFNKMSLISGIVFSNWLQSTEKISNSKRDL